MNNNTNDNFTCPACPMHFASALGCAEHYRLCTNELPDERTPAESVLDDLVAAERVLYDLVDEGRAMREKLAELEAANISVNEKLVAEQKKFAALQGFFAAARREVMDQEGTVIGLRDVHYQDAEDMRHMCAEIKRLSRLCNALRRALKAVL